MLKSRRKGMVEGVGTGRYMRTYLFFLFLENLGVE